MSPKTTFLTWLEEVKGYLSSEDRDIADESRSPFLRLWWQEDCEPADVALELAARCQKRREDIQRKKDEPVGRVYQAACNDMVAAKRRGDTTAAERYFAAASALQDAYPDLVAAYVKDEAPH